MANMSQLENRLFKHYFDDGLLDMFIGVGLALLGAAWLCEMVALGAIVPVVLMPLWKPLRERLVESRAGSIKFKAERQVQNKASFTKWMLFGIVILASEVFIIFVVDRETFLDSDWFIQLVPGLPSILIAAPLVVVALYLGIGRLCFYGVLSAGFGLLVMIDTAIEPGHAILLTGVSTLLVGSLVFFQFIRKSQLASQDEGS